MGHISRENPALMQFAAMRQCKMEGCAHCPSAVTRAKNGFNHSFGMGARASFCSAEAA
jgi:hypothetical protein